MEIGMLALPIWLRWPDDQRASWMTSWITCTISADRHAWTTIFPSLKRDSASRQSDGPKGGSLDIYRRSRRRIFASSAIGPIHGPKWPKERSPGFTLGSFPHPELALKGPRDTATIDSARLNRTACVCLAP